MELIRQPVYLLLMCCSSYFMVFLSCVPYFGFGDDVKLVKDSSMAVMLLTGLFGAVLSSASSLSREIRTGTALAVLAKPVSRVQLLLAKYCGVALALTVVAYVNILSALIAGRMAYDAYGNVDNIGLGIYTGALILAFLMGGFTNYFLRRQFVADAVFSVAIMVTLAFVMINCINKDGQWQTFAKDVDWRMVPVGLLVLFAVWLLAGISTACATRLDVIPTLAVCSAFFLLGIMSDYLFGRTAENGSWLASILYTLTPNWQQFWLTDTLDPGKKGVPMPYLLQAFGYMLSYLGATLALGLALFEDRELT